MTRAGQHFIGLHHVTITRQDGGIEMYLRVLIEPTDDGYRLTDRDGEAVRILRRRDFKIFTWRGVR